jgi:hypothetical protein
METSDKIEAHNFLLKLKSETEFKNAWIFTGKFDLTKKPADELIVGYLVEPTDNSQSMQGSLIDSERGDPSASKPYYFNIVSSDGKKISGNLLVKETDESSPAWIQSGKLVYLKKPRNEHQSFELVAMFPGYRAGSLVCFYNHPAIEKGPSNENIVTLVLEKARKENFMDFSNVRFIGNSSFLRTVSQYELNELVSLLRAYPAEKIIIYSACNEKQEQAFAAEQHLLETSNFKSLSMARAEAVKSYLVQQGIDASRIFTKGEGLLSGDGSFKPINNSIEIEFVKSNATTALY